jgi:hypothetical protein
MIRDITPNGNNKAVKCPQDLTRMDLIDLRRRTQPTPSISLIASFGAKQNSLLLNAATNPSSGNANG